MTVAFDGPAIALAIISTDARGVADGTSIWDTWVGGEVLPRDIAAQRRHGSETWQLGVWEAGTPHNTATGALAPFGEGRHEVTLFASDNGTVGTERWFRLVIERPDHRLDKSPLFHFAR
jgi:hypothetical protein